MKMIRKTIEYACLAVGCVIMAPWLLLKCLTFALYVVLIFVIAWINALLLCDLKIVYRRLKEKVGSEYSKLF